MISVMLIIACFSGRSGSLSGEALHRGDVLQTVVPGVLSWTELFIRDSIWKLFCLGESWGGEERLETVCLSCWTGDPLVLQEVVFGGLFGFGCLSSSSPCFDFSFCNIALITCGNYRVHGSCIEQVFVLQLMLPATNCLKIM